MSVVRCYDDEGTAHDVAVDSLGFSPAVYGIFIENERLLLLANGRTGLCAPPGCILTANEAPTQAIRHYFRRLTGITPQLGPLLLLEDQFRWLDGRAWRIAAMYFAVSRPFTASLHFDETLDPDITPQWVDLFDLQRNQFLFGLKAVVAGAARSRDASQRQSATATI